MGLWGRTWRLRSTALSYIHANDVFCIRSALCRSPDSPFRPADRRPSPSVYCLKSHRANWDRAVKWSRRDVVPITVETGLCPVCLLRPHPLSSPSTFVRPSPPSPSTFFSQHPPHSRWVGAGCRHGGEGQNMIERWGKQSELVRKEDSSQD